MKRIAYWPYRGLAWMGSKRGWIAAALLLWANAALAQSCPGDIDGDGQITVEEMVARVNDLPAVCSPCVAGALLDGLALALRGCPVPSGWTAGVFLPSVAYAARCPVPRTGIDPLTGSPYADVQGTSVDENNWLRSWTNETYLWYREVPDLDPGLYQTPEYFDRLRTSATTPRGRPKDRFHFTVPTDEFLRLAQSGQQVGYGAQWAVLSGPRVLVAYTEPDSPAVSAEVNLTRGAQVLAVDGITIASASTPNAMDTVLRGLYPESEHEEHTFSVLDPGSSLARNVRMQATLVAPAPVQAVRTLATESGNVGYMLFNSHIGTAEAALIDAVEQLHAAAISDLILDLRYNTGGYIDVANELASMMAGRERTAGRVFERNIYNDRYLPRDLMFHQRAVGFSVPRGRELPALGLSRVFVLTGPDTCSASESIINSLRGIDVEVIQIGSTTCGKPYVFLPEDNCGTMYFTIQIHAVNAKGFGEYDDGFSPENTPGFVTVRLPGCAVADDYTHALGDPGEARLAAALMYRSLGTCPPAPRSAARAAAGGSHRDLSVSDGYIPRHAWEANRLFAPPPLRARE